VTGYNPPRDWIACEAFLKDGTLASGSANGTVKLWDLTTGKAKDPLRVGGEVRAMAVRPSGDLLAVSRFVCFVRGGINLFLFDLRTGRTLISIQNEPCSSSMLRAGGLDQ
jgi:WD40 repeat protein